MSTYPYFRIKEDIKKRILEGEWLGDTRLPSSRDFAEAYKSSVNTVEKAIKELCEEGMLRRDKRRGTYIENGVVSPMGQSRSGLIAASVVGIDNPLWASALRGIQDVLQLRGFHLLSYSDDRDLDKLESLIKGAVAKRVDGVILSPIYDHNHEERNQRLYELLKNNGIKVIFLDRYMYNSDIPFVTSDNAAGAYQLTKLLINKGHRRILFIRNSDLSTFNERLLGVKQAFLDSGIAFDPELDVLLPTQSENFADEFETYSSKLASLITESGCTAIFSANDQLAEAAIAALDKLNLRIPEHISLVTYDALNLNLKLKLDITGVNQPFYDMGRTAALQLMNLLEGKEHLSVLGQICKGELNQGSSIGKVPQAALN
ncbi:GntR family transcriptional regulator [Paenibacillus gorillae]|uniref:GntR family transcriptional regulator n=1 Tax=Paenibacillus gorillae TaxID=1243662 RepID=UPI0004B84A53|nr:GntR family transcriptional regulator [Paenibacillus gorillae]